MTTIPFEERIQKAKDLLPALLPNIEAYLVSNIFSRLTVYIVDANDDILNHAKEVLQTISVGVASITNNDFIYTDLQSGKEVIEDTNPLLFIINRHADKNNWYLAPHDKPKRNAHLTAFYSFKGGLGRTTALVLSALQLARQGKRIALVDFDLEAPGLGPLFQSDIPNVATVRGTADFLLDWQANENPILDLAGYYFSLTQQDLVGSAGGELIVFPATYSARTDEKASMNYIDKLSNIRLQYNASQPGNYAPDALFNLIDEQINPDFIFIDTRTGINDIGGLVLQRYADSAFLFFQGNTQNMFGLEALLPKVLSFNIPFYLINSPTPREQINSIGETTYFLNTSYQIFYDLKYKFGEIPDIEDETADHYPINIPYSDTASFLDSTAKLRSLLEEGGSENPYLQLAKLALAETEEPITLPLLEEIPDADNLVQAMSTIIDKTAASEYEFYTEDDLRRNFYPRHDYRFIFERNKFVVLGEKGSGKTALYAVLSQENYARELARYCGVSSQEWERTTWIKGLDIKGERYPSSTNFEALGDLSDNQLRTYWLILLCREVDVIYTAINPEIILSKDISSARLPNLKSLAQDKAVSEQLEDYLAQVNTDLASSKRYLTIVYDYLDLLLTEEDNLRGRLVGALLRLWYEYHNRFANLRTKVFLRKDIYDREISSGLTDKVKLDNFKQEIEWNLPQLLNMVWKRILERAPNNGLLFVAPVMDGAPVPKEKTLGLIPNFTQEQHTKLLELVFGKRMGGNNKAFPYRWIEQHISDTHRHIQPRSILNLFGLGAQRQLEDLTKSITPIRPQNFESVLGVVSSSRVQDLAEEYPGLRYVLNELKEYLKQFPVQEIELHQAIESIKIKHVSLIERDADDIMHELIDIGILYEYKFNKTAAGGIRYHIPDLYLFGLGLTRRGPGAQKNIFDYQRRAIRRR